MNREVKSQLPFIRFLKTSSKVQRNYLIESSTREQLQAIIDILYNILIGNCSIGINIKNKISKYKSIMRQNVDKKLSRKKRKVLFKKLNPLLPLFLTEALKCM